MNGRVKTILGVSVLTAGLVVSGCGNKEPNFKEKEVTNAVLTFIGQTEEEYNKRLSEEAKDKELLEVETDRKMLPTKMTDKYYDNLDSMILALKSGKINSITIGSSTAKYILSKNDDMEERMLKEVGQTEEAKETRNLPDTSYGMLLMDKNKELADKVSEAIKDMKKDGTLDKLVDKYITNSNNSERVEIKKTDAAKTIKVAITGDLPPMDFIEADGTPAGFNTAVMAEVAKKLGVNVEFVQINSGARVTTLASDKADLVFWTRILDENSKEDIAEGTILTETYYSEPVSVIGMKEKNN